MTTRRIEVRNPKTGQVHFFDVMKGRTATSLAAAVVHAGQVPTDPSLTLKRSDNDLLLEWDDPIDLVHGDADAFEIVWRGMGV